MTINLFAPIEHPVDLENNNLLYEVVVGSHAYGLANEHSDVDIRGVYAVPTDQFLSLWYVKDKTFDERKRDLCYWEIRHFLRLAVKCNPNILECLWSPLVRFEHALFAELRENKRKVLSRPAIVKAYSNYALDQFKRYNNAKDIPNKEVSHLIRLVIAGYQLLQTGEVMVDVGNHRAWLAHIKKNGTSLDQIELFVADAKALVYENSILPEEPDIKWLEDWLLRVREEFWPKANSLHPLRSFE